jgi:RimJ/RimL family protein N-acetyltransferase
MVEGDAEELCSLLPQTHAESDFLNYRPGEFDMNVEQEREFIREHNAKPGSVAWVAEVDGEIVGFGGAMSPPYKRLSHHAEFGLAVVKAYWGLGIGRKLCDWIDDWGKGAGLRKMYLRVFAHNERAIALYESLGYVEEGRLKGDVLRGDGTYGDTIIMAKFFVD